MQNERGQMTVVAAAVVALLLAAVVVIAVVGRSMIARSTSTVAADAAALAVASDPDAGRAVVDWYRDRGFTVAPGSIAGGAQARATNEQAQATSRAIADTTVTESPVLHAVVARASQLLGHELEPLEIDVTTVQFSPADAARFDSLAASFGLCLVGAGTYAGC